MTDKCPHCFAENSRLRRRVCAGGMIQYRVQCLNCGGSIGNAVARVKIPDIESVEPWDDDLAARREDEWHKNWYDQQSAAARNAQISQQEWRQKYEAHLRSPEWAEKRRLVLARDGHLCQGCRTRKATEVHHLTYDHLGNEFLWELASICRTCHQRLHGRKD